VNSSIVIIGSDDVAGSTAYVCSGAVCVTGNIIDGVPELITVVCDVDSWGSNVKVAFQAQHGLGIMRSLVVGGYEVCHEFVVNVGMCFDGFLVGRVSRNQLSYACSLAAPLAASPWRKMMMSVLLVR
jgi:hypothetical protein